MGGYKAILENEATVEELVDIKQGNLAGTFSSLRSSMLIWFINQDIGKVATSMNSPSVLCTTDVPFYGNNQMLMKTVILGE